MLRAFARCMYGRSCRPYARAMSEPGQPQGPEYQNPPYGSPPPGYPPPAAHPPAGYPAPGYGPPPPRSEDTVWAILAHLSIFAFGLIGPLVIYLVFKDTSPFTRHHAAEALNFHITLLIATIVSAVLTLLLVGFFLLLGLMIAAVVFAILATVAASRREAYRYPLTIRFVT